MSSRRTPTSIACAAVRDLTLLGALSLLAAGCGQSAKAPPPAPTAQVAVVTARSQPVPLTRDLVGRLSATRVADVRARAAGVLLKRLYKEGSDVQQGQVLFQIDPAPLQAALSGALAALAQAQANATNAHVSAQRDRELIASGLVSRSDLDNAEAAERSTAAAVLQAQANVDTARINLGYAKVAAPIAGRASQQAVTEGALVGQGTATLLTTVEQIDPIYVNFDQPAIEVERLHRAQATGNITLVDRNKAAVQLTLPDGAPYGRAGTLDFRDASVDPATGAVALRGLIPNPDRQLLPGMYVSVRLTVGTLKRAVLVPQAAVQRDGTGPYVLVVGSGEVVVQKRVATESLSGPEWIITEGLADDDRVIVSGIQGARPGVRVTAVPYRAGGETASVATAAPTPGR